MSVQTFEQVREMIHVFGYLAVIHRKQLAKDEKDAYDYGIGDNFCQSLNSLPTRVKFGVLS